MPARAPTSAWLLGAVLSLLVLGPAGCEEQPPPQPEPEASGESETTARAGPAAPEGPPPADEEAEREPVEQALGGPAEPQGDPCENAYGSMRAMMDAVKKRGGRNAEMPPKNKFMAACAELPEQLQLCMDVRYFMAHERKCKEAQANVDPELRAKVKRLVGKRPGGANTGEPDGP